jgi:hypothetical protein
MGVLVVGCAGHVRNFLYTAWICDRCVFIRQIQPGSHRSERASLAFFSHFNIPLFSIYPTTVRL